MKTQSQNYNKLKKRFTEDSLHFHHVEVSFKTHMEFLGRSTLQRSQQLNPSPRSKLCPCCRL